MRRPLSRYVDAKILLIDDDATNNLLLENILYNHGFKQIRSITDPRLARGTIVEYEPELILLDLEMPYMNGFEVFRRLQMMNKDNMLPVMVITAKNDQKNKIHALSLGIQYFLEKPVDKIELVTRAQNIIHINRLYNRSLQKNMSIEAELEQVNKRAINIEHSIIESLLSSIRFRDQETGDHVCRISDLVYILSSGMGLTNLLSDKLAMASKLHDIGKIGIPDSILLKQGKLTADERAIMEKHTLIGGRILSVESSEILKLAGEVAQTHHENWDGTGYPHGLAKKQIPLAGRLTAVADVFDALLSYRPYKRAWSFDKAAKYIQAEEGKKFDPDIVSVFTENIERINLIYNGLPEKIQ